MIALGFSLIAAFSPVFLAGALSITLLLLLILYRPFIGLCAIILMQISVLSPDPDINVVEIIFGVSFLAMLFLALIHAFLIRGENLLVTAKDWILLGFLTYAIVMGGFLTWAADGKMSAWFRITIYISYYFFYFLCRQFVRTKSDLKWLGFSLVVVVVAHMFQQNYFYFQRLMSITALWEILSSRIATLEILFFVGFVYSLTFYCATHSLRIKMICGILSIGFAIALITTFTRSYWLVTLIATGGIFLMLTNRQRLHLVLYAVISGSIILLIGNIILDDFFTMIMKSIFMRFTSTAQGTRDISLAARVIEAQTLWPKIAINPIFGYGSGSFYTYYSPVELSSHRTNYVHIEWLDFLFKYGLIGTILFSAFYFKHLWHSFILWLSTKDTFLKPVLLGIFITTGALLITTIAGHQFTHKAGAFVISISAAIVENLRTRRLTLS